MGDNGDLEKNGDLYGGPKSEKGPLGDPLGSSDNGDLNMKVAMILFSIL